MGSVMGQKLELSSDLASLSRKTSSDESGPLSSEYGTVWTAALLVVSILLLGTMLREALHRKNNLPPGPRGLPIFGSLFSLGLLPYKSLHKLSLKHGALVHLRLGSIPCLVVSSSAMTREIVLKHDVEFADRPSKLFSQLLFKKKDIVNSSYGPAWRHLRMICTSQFFTTKQIASSEAGRRAEIHALVKLILQKTSSDADCVVNLPFLLRNSVTNIISRMIFNKRLFGDGEQGNDEEAKAYQEIVSMHFRAYAVFVISDYIPWLSFITKLQGIPEKMKKLADRIIKKVDALIEFENHKKRRVNHEPEAAERAEERDFVELLLSTPSHDGSSSGLDYDTVRGVVMNMLFAGSETQSTTLEWAMAHLLRHPDVMERAQAELVDVVGTHRVVEEADLGRLPYLEAVTKEISRLQPGAPLAINHESREATRVAGYNLPAKTRLILNIHSIHRDPAAYERPDEFNPSRFLNLPGDSYPSFQFMPFGAGRRICPGMPLANVNVPHLLAHLLHSFDWALPEGLSPQELEMSETFDGVTASRLRPLLAIAKPRTSAFLY